MKTQQRLENYRKGKNCTLLGVGPMSKNCVDATIELADQYKDPLMLIASRRQVDSEQFAGGYVENWSTRQFADYLRSKDINQNIIYPKTKLSIQNTNCMPEWITNRRTDFRSIYPYCNSTKIKFTNKFTIFVYFVQFIKL